MRLLVLLVSLIACDRRCGDRAYALVISTLDAESMEDVRAEGEVTCEAVCRAAFDAQSHWSIEAIEACAFTEAPESELPDTDLPDTDPPDTGPPGPIRRGASVECRVVITEEACPA